MDNITYLKWSRLHNDPNFRNELPEILLHSWEKSYNLGIDAENSLPVLLSKEQFSKIRENWKSLYYYANDALSIVGEEHFSKFAINFAMYFAPVIYEGE